MSKGKKVSGLGVLFGAAVGLAAGYWLNTEKGKIWRKKSTEDFNKWTSEQQEVLNEQYENLKSSTEEVLKKGEAYIQEAEVKFKEKINHAAKEAKMYAEKMEQETKF